MRYLREFIAFLKAVAGDNRIPDRDKMVLTALIALILSPFDLIPDWIPIIGLLDDVVILAVVCDYFFNHLDSEVVLSHWPWGMKSYTRVRRLARMIAAVTPPGIRRRIWTYKPSVYGSHD